MRRSILRITITRALYHSLLCKSLSINYPIYKAPKFLISTIFRNARELYEEEFCVMLVVMFIHTRRSQAAQEKMER